MKTNNSPAPRMLCRLIRWRSDLLGGSTASHVAHCADCRRYFGAIDDLDAALRRDAAVSHAVPSAGLDEAILAAVGARAGTRRRPHPAWAWTGVAAAVAAALFISLRLERPSVGTSASGEVSADVVALADAAHDWSDQVFNSTLPSAGAFVEDNALRQEADALYADARSAVSFLALNFLPTAPDADVKPPTPRKT